MMRYPGSLGRPAKAGLCCLAAVAVTAATVGAARTSGAAQAASTPPACSPAQQQPPTGPTTVTTIGQAYYCIFAHYYSGPVLDDRVLLAGAFAGLTQELDRLGIDQPDATMPALTGSRDRDWAAFAAVYRRVIGKVPSRDVQQVAAATMTGMVAALNDNHARWQYPARNRQEPPPATSTGWASTPHRPPGWPSTPPARRCRRRSSPSVDPRSPAARAGVRTGDIITAVDGAPPFTDGMLSPGVFTCSTSPTRSSRRCGSRCAGRSPAPPGPSRSPRPPTPPRPGRDRQAARRPHRLRARCRRSTPAPPARSWPRSRAWRRRPRCAASSWTCAATAAARPSRSRSCSARSSTAPPGATTAPSPAGAPPTTPTPARRGCCTCHWRCSPTATATRPATRSAGAVKDLHLGTLIGTRTAGIVAGPAAGWVLDDGSVLGLPPKHERRR